MMEETPAPMTAVDLFCGCGGMSMGFANAGYELLGAYDNWPAAVDVYRANFNTPVHNSDLTDEAIVDEIAALRPDVIIGGPPCQDFSSAGLQREDGGRAVLTVRYAEIIARCRPRIVVMENVPRAGKSKAMSELRRILKAQGYGITERVIDASRVGVPQMRKRLILIGCIDAEDGFLEVLLEEGLSDHRTTIRDYLGDSLGTDFYFRVPRSYSRRAVFSIDEPSATIRGVDRPIPPGYKPHPGDAAPLSAARCLTPKERSLIQTFPADFTLFGSKTDVNQMIGNAVPVKLAEYIAVHINRYLSGGDYEKR